MPPPSPSQQTSTMNYSGPRAPHPPFAGGRELPGIGSSHRSSGSGGMSISSMLGNDAPPTQAPPPLQHSPPATTQSPNIPAMQPPSPRRGYSSGPRVDYAWRRPQTPERHPAPSAFRQPESTYAAGSSPRHFSAAKGSPDYPRSDAAHIPHSYPTSVPHGARPYQPPHDVNEREIHRQPDERAPPRPSSQPVGLGPVRDSAPREDAHARPPHSYAASPLSRRPDDSRQMAYAERHLPSDRPVTAEPLSHSVFSPPRIPKQDAIRHEIPGGQRHSFSQELRDENSRDGNLIRREEYPQHLRTAGGFRPQYMPSHNPAHAPLSAAEAPRSHPQGMDPFRRSIEQHPPTGVSQEHRARSHRTPDRMAMAYNQHLEQQQQQQQHQSQPPQQQPHHQPQERRNDETPASGHPNFHATDLRRTTSYEQHPRQSHPPHPHRSGEEMQRSRSFLSLMESHKRGRASPLPQAVQGAQAQSIGPNADPSIKSEFGRIFQGLGSGLGGHIPGVSTPSRQSPMPQRLSTGGLADGETVMLSDNDGRMVRMGSARGMGAAAKTLKSRRVKDEDVRGEGEDGRRTPIGRGSKRAKTTHHHHHHIHAPVRGGLLGTTHRHHAPLLSQTPRPDEELSPGKFPGPPSGAAHHHHHHVQPAHHHHHHHHHHTPRGAASSSTVVPHVPAPKPALKVNSQAVLDAIEDKPRNHLGSELYEPEISLPPTATTPLGSKFGFQLQYKPSRVFTEKDLNCTFTIRVPRFYLAQHTREKVCLDRNVFGTEVYTDDSDPLAAAMHAGWIRGAWDESYDVSLLDIPDESLNRADDDVDENNGVLEVMTARPAAPVTPPSNRDLQITIVIAPKLEKYKGTTRFGVASRSWGGNHDGLSYMILRVRWVDEGLSRGFGRSGEARRKSEGKLRESTAWLEVRR
ncbi:Rxt3-domain-containing protein [Trichodelitschia bisporula]|uniref:Rxt3-domain-containing protein n=1 Tax=Trichodelitschia bisporula TaxID=703511 RepID=A0A6G1IA63_9PEZI|nr:Rxt3-domain-containing protein [Trichodelitschia bisporula]